MDQRTCLAADPASCPWKVIEVLERDYSEREKAYEELMSECERIKIQIRELEREKRKKF